MTEHLQTHVPPRARPVAELVDDAAPARSQELAKRWVVALLHSRPLTDAGTLPLDELAREAPLLCGQAIRAVQSDIELQRLTGRGAPTGREGSAAALRLAAISGSADATALVETVEALRGVLWEALRDELNEQSARQVGDVCDRVAYVCAAMLAAAVEAAAAPAAGSFSDAADSVIDAPPEQRAQQLAGTPSRRHRAVIVDERAGPAVEGASPGPERPLSWDESPPVPPGTRAEIEIHDERSTDSGQGPAAWIRSIGGQLERFEQDRLPFAVLLVELVEIERVRSDELLELSGQLERALKTALDAGSGAGSGALTRERPGRFWLLAAQTDRAGARDLAERLVHEVASRSGDVSAPLEVAIGAAVCPEDAREAAALAAHADVGLYADRSAVRASGGRAPSPMDQSV